VNRLSVNEWFLQMAIEKDLIQTTPFLVPPGGPADLFGRSTDFRPDDLSKSDAEKRLQRIKSRLSDLQYQLYSENKRSLLVVLQAMDAGGKDGTIRKVMTGFNPQGCKVHSFKKPTERELEHDFLWRIHRVCPPKGEIGVFNRSHYEDVLVVRIHDLVPEEKWRSRYDVINGFESILQQHGTKVVKFFLHISPEEQLQRFAKRLENPKKNWKISDSDYSERKFWPKYIEAFEEAIQRCNSQSAPWYVIPADNKWFRDLAIASVLHQTLTDMDLQMPKPTVNLFEIQKMYHQAVKDSSS